MLRLMAALLLVVSGGSFTLAKPEPQPRRTVSVAAAADLKFALDAAIEEFNRHNSDIRIVVSYGSSGNFFAQLSNRAPFDVFFSADVEYPRKLIETGLADRQSEFLYAVGRIVVWTRSDSPVDVERDGVRSLLDSRVRKIAIANPRHAPYGRAAEAAMKSLGVFDDAKLKLIFGENVAQAAHFVESGGADAGIIALSLALAPALREKGRFWEIPLDAYPRLEQGGVIMERASDPRAARAFVDFVTSPAGRSILERFGFVLPARSNEPTTQPANLLTGPEK